MDIEQSIQPVSSIFLRSDSAQFRQQTNSFQDIFRRAMIQKSNSRPPKIELTGVLIPCAEPKAPVSEKFKLETDQNEYRLRMNNSLLAVAKKIEWEEVIVRGYLDLDKSIFEVERLSLLNRGEPYRLPLGPMDWHNELDQYKKSIARKGMLDLAPEDLAG